MGIWRAITAAAGLALIARTAVAADFATDDATRFFQFTFDIIADRTIQPISPRDMAVDGLQGLTQIDPAVSVSLAPGSIRLLLAGQPAAEFTPPADDDTAGWGEIVANAVTQARGSSAALTKADNEAVYQAVMTGILGHLDPFSRYSGAVDAESRRDAREGYGGIGVHYGLSTDHLTVTDVQEGSPAALAGVQNGDIITAIDGHPVSEMGGSRQDVSDHLRGVAGSRVKLRLVRPTQTIDITLRRALIVPPTVTLAPDNGDGIAVVRISAFNETTTQDLSAAITQAKQRFNNSVRGVVLDLRGNPGGLLDQAVEVVDLFLTHGTIVSTEGRAIQSIHAYAAQTGDVTGGAPLVLLVDGGSASASEIVAAAMQDNERAVVVGSTSYGKGTVQTVVRLPNNGELALTWSRFHSPSGYTLQGLGVLPSVCVSDENEGINSALTQSLTAEATTMAIRWRSVRANDVVGRQVLRAYCRPQNETAWQSDLDVARRLIDDHDEYLAALTPTIGQAASR